MEPNEIVHSDPEIVSGAPVLVGTRVPAQALLDYLEGGESIEEFLDDFPSVSREQSIAFIEEAGLALLARLAGSALIVLFRTIRRPAAILAELHTRALGAR